VEEVQVEVLVEGVQLEGVPLKVEVEVELELS
jgi:hypothetical protein